MNPNDIIKSYGRLNPHYVNGIHKTIKAALEEHPRTFAIRVDLRLPAYDVVAATDAGVISRFIDSLKAKIAADLHRKQKKGIRVHPCTLRYIWVREFDKKENKKHYHAFLLLNKDTYAFLGDYRQSEGNLSVLITQAWLSALRLTGLQYRRLPRIPENPYYYLNAKTLDTDGIYPYLIARVYYMAKARSKISVDGERNFGCSQG